MNAGLVANGPLKSQSSQPGDPEQPNLAQGFVDEFVSGLLASYSTTGGFNNRDSHNMPSTRAVGQICHDLLQLLFPVSMTMMRCIMVPLPN